MSKNTSISKEQYDLLDAAYREFNKHLFGNQLPDVMIVLHRKGKRTNGYFHAERFFDRQAAMRDSKKKKKNVPTYDELSLNPDSFVGRTDTAILSTLAHEMCHVWQYRCTDKFPRNGYHDKKWGAKMKEIGLYPSNTGAEGGKETGQQMTHYIIKGGTFERYALKFLKGRSIKLSSFPLPSMSGQSNKNKVKYSCPSCESNIWGKPGLNVRCGECDEQFSEV